MPGRHDNESTGWNEGHPPGHNHSFNPPALLGEGPAAAESLDSLAVRRELAAASVAALGDFWDNEDLRGT